MGERIRNFESNDSSKESGIDKEQENKLLLKRIEQRKGEIFNLVVLKLEGMLDQDFQRFVNLIEERGLSYSVSKEYGAEASEDSSVNKSFKINFDNITSFDFLRLLSHLKEKNVDFKYEM